MGVREGVLIERLRKDLQDVYGNKIRLFRRQSSLVKQDGRYVRHNYKGQADLDGFVSLHHVPCFLAIEVKAGKLKPSKSQIERSVVFSRLGVIYHFVSEPTYEKDLKCLHLRIEDYQTRIENARRIQ